MVIDIKFKLYIRAPLCYFCAQMLQFHWLDYSLSSP